MNDNQDLGDFENTQNFSPLSIKNLLSPPESPPHLSGDNIAELENKHHEQKHRVTNTGKLDLLSSVTQMINTQPSQYNQSSPITLPPISRAITPRVHSNSHPVTSTHGRIVTRNRVFNEASSHQQTITPRYSPYSAAYDRSSQPQRHNVTTTYPRIQYIQPIDSSYAPTPPPSRPETPATTQTKIQENVKTILEKPEEIIQTSTGYPIDSIADIIKKTKSDQSRYSKSRKGYIQDCTRCGFPKSRIHGHDPAKCHPFETCNDPDCHPEYIKERAYKKQKYRKLEKEIDF